MSNKEETHSCNPTEIKHSHDPTRHNHDPIEKTHSHNPAGKTHIHDLAKKIHSHNPTLERITICISSSKDPRFQVKAIVTLTTTRFSRKTSSNKL